MHHFFKEFLDFFEEFLFKKALSSYPILLIGKNTVILSLLREQSLQHAPYLYKYCE